jgi:hypothetical protein
MARFRPAFRINLPGQAIPLGQHAISMQGFRVYAVLKWSILFKASGTKSSSRLSIPSDLFWPFPNFQLDRFARKPLNMTHAT